MRMALVGKRGTFRRMRLSLAVSMVVISCTTACTPVEALSSVVAKAGSDSELLLKTNEDLSPGDVVHLWHYSCSRGHGTHCRYDLIATGMVTTVVTDKVQYAFVQVAPGTHVSIGDRAVKPSPMSYWHPDQEAPF
jgi:hypothetical protein